MRTPLLRLSLVFLSVSISVLPVHGQDELCPFYNYDISWGPGEHETLGHPSPAIRDVNDPDDYLIERDQYVLSYNRDKGEPNWVEWHLDTPWIGLAHSRNDFHPDSSLPTGWYSVRPTDYTNSGFDRGHMCNSADRTATEDDNSATFVTSNLVPQAPANNRGPYERLEMYCSQLAREGNELYIFTGPAGQGGIGSNGGVTDTVADGRVVVPANIWKSSWYCRPGPTIWTE